MLKNISIKLKLILSFSIIVVMIVILALYSIYSTGKSGDGFINFQKMTSNSELVSSIKSNMLKTSVSVNEYLVKENEDSIDDFNKNFQSTYNNLIKAEKQFNDEEITKLLLKMHNELDIYKESFLQIVELTQERDKIKKETLDVIGEDIEHLLSLVIKKTNKNGKYEESFAVSEALKDVVLARMYTYKFLDSRDKNDFHKVYEIFNALKIELEEIQEKIEDPIVYSQFNMSFKFILSYKSSAFSIYDVITTKNKVINEKLNVLGQDIALISDQIEKAIKDKQHQVGVDVTDLNSSIKSLITIISLIIVVFSVIIAFVFPRHISQQIESFQTGLLNFFKYLNKESSSAEPIKIDGDNEISKMGILVNNNIEKTKKMLVQDNELIEDVKKVVEIVKGGNFTSKVNKSTDNESLEELKNSFNEMLENIRNNVCDDVNKILKVLDAYSKLDFREKIDDNTGRVSIGLNNVSQIITDMLVQNQSIGLTLDKSSDKMMKNMDMLNRLSTETAASLEETAAALEEITSTIISNSDNVTKMSNYADVLNQSASDGQDLAQNTTTAMDDITQQVTLINESISVIDQIAFQTNILSLNAAVEAATAGEAGKGFAVVAQEVRNLATRSAEAAKEIKDIVENATLKAEHGKSISGKMISGYSSLLENINKSIEMIQEINHASKEQEAGISQINDAVTQLDQQTQQNAQIANETQDIAIETDQIAKEIVDDANKKEFVGKQGF